MVKIVDKQQRFILMTFLLGVLLGAIDSGIVSPALFVMQQEFGVSSQWLVWVVTAYTLVYAISMPIVAKAADRLGRRQVFLMGVLLFGIGSVVAALSFSFPMLITGRMIQALGAGGIIPIANAVIGTSFPEEKRGAALGLIGAMFGIGSLLGPNLGAFLVDRLTWHWIFWVNVPIVAVILILGRQLPKEQVEQETKPIDVLGTILLSGFVGTFLLGLTNIDPYRFGSSVVEVKVWGLLVLSFLLLALFIPVERRAQDPMVELHYFKNKNIVLALIMSTITGIGIISLIFIPQFSETLLGLAPGQGGYIVTILALAAGVTAPVGGVLIDRFGAKLVTGTGFLLSALGSAWLAYVATGWVTLSIGLVLSGFGIGFTMGTPLNYIMLKLTPEEEASSALSLVSLVRSLGTSLGPILLVTVLSIGVNRGTNGSGMSPGEQMREATLSGFSYMYTAASVIFIVGLVLTLMLSLKPNKN